MKKQKNSAIPVFAIPIVNRGDLLLRLVKSLDMPIQKLVIVNNGNDDSVTDAIHQLHNGFNSLMQTVEVVHTGKNIGVAASWNKIIAEYADVPYWIICANDMVFTKHGDLFRMWKQIEEKKNTHHMLYADGYSCFTVTRLGRDFLTHPDTPGMFDENIWPAYFEDDDHFYRVKLSGAVTTGFTMFKMKHGTGIEGDKDENGSATIAANPKINEANGVLFQSNALYIDRKWGSTKPDHDRFKTPYGNPNTDLHYWELDAERHNRDLQIWDMIVKE